MKLGQQAIEQYTYTIKAFLLGSILYSIFSQIRVLLTSFKINWLEKALVEKPKRQWPTFLLMLMGKKKLRLWKTLCTSEGKPDIHNMHNNNNNKKHFKTYLSEDIPKTRAALFGLYCVNYSSNISGILDFVSC